jgi:Flp pilus assembly protein TadG
VEFALVLPILMLLVMGAIDWGYYFYVDQVVTNAAREGARAGTIWEADTEDSEAQSDAESTALDYLTRGGLDSGSATVTVSLLDETVSGKDIDLVSVTVSYPTSSLTGFLATFIPGTAEATAEMRQ